MKEVMKMKSAIAKFCNAATEAWESQSHIVAILMIIAGVVIGVSFVFGFLCLRAWIIMLLWNWIAVSLFNAPVLNIWLALGLSLLCSMLFKSSSNKDEKD